MGTVAERPPRYRERHEPRELFARCVVPTRDPLTAEAFVEFQKTFIGRRRETLPSWAPASRFDHFYRLCVNTRIPETQAVKTLKVGDEVALIGMRRIE